MLKTPLYDCHIAANARMVDFSGWNMPINYGSQINEHNQVRQECGIFDVSHMLVVEVKGSDSQKFLRYLLANDVIKLGFYNAQYGCMLNQDAGIVDDLITYKIDDDNYRIVINAGNRVSDVEWIKSHSKNYDVEVTARNDLAIIAIQGPKAVEIMSAIIPESTSLKPFTFMLNNGWMIARTGYTGEDGFEVALPDSLAVEFWQKLVAHGAHPIGLGARDTLRLEAGMHLYGSDMNTQTSPLERGLGWSVDLNDTTREFIGKTAVLAKKEQGVDTKWVGVVLRSKGVLRSGQEIDFADGSKGLITSGSFSPTLKVAIGLAYIPKNAVDATVNIRGKVLDIEVTKPRFVKNGKPLIDL